MVRRILRCSLEWTIYLQDCKPAQTIRYDHYSLHVALGKHALNSFTGPIVRISPHELHISDAAYYEHLYRQEGIWNKYHWANKAFGVPNSTITCVDHNLHKRRRAPLERFMSKANVVKNIDIIQRLTTSLSDRIGAYAGKAETINLGSAISAFVRDVATELLLGKTYNNLGKEDFNEGMTAVFQGGGHVWRLTKHMPWFGPLMKSMPTSLIEKIGDQGAKDFFGYLNVRRHIMMMIYPLPKKSSIDIVLHPGHFGNHQGPS